HTERDRLAERHRGEEVGAEIEAIVPAVLGEEVIAEDLALPVAEGAAARDGRERSDRERGEGAAEGRPHGPAAELGARRAPAPGRASAIGPPPSTRSPR